MYPIPNRGGGQHTHSCPLPLAQACGLASPSRLSSLFSLVVPTTPCPAMATEAAASSTAAGTMPALAPAAGGATAPATVAPS